MAGMYLVHHRRHAAVAVILHGTMLCVYVYSVYIYVCMWNSSSSSSSNGRTALRDGAEKGRLEKGSDKMDDGCMKRTHTLPVGRGGGLSSPPRLSRKEGQGCRRREERNTHAHTRARPVRPHHGRCNLGKFRLLRWQHPCQDLETPGGGREGNQIVRYRTGRRA